MSDTTESIFGTPVEPDKEKFPFLFDEGEAPAAPEESTETETPAQTAAPVEEVPAVEVSEPSEVAPQDTLPEAQEGEAEGEYLWAGKYKTPQELEKGYRNSRTQTNRERERAAAFEEQARSAQLQVQETQRQMRQLAMYVQQQQYARQQAPQDPYAEQQPQVPQQQGIDPQLLPYLVREGVAEQTRAAEDRIRAEFEERQIEVARQSAVYGFYDRHPEITPESPQDIRVRETLRAFEDAWGEYEPVIENPETLEIALEASNNPALQRVLELNPQYIDTEDGMEMARVLAAAVRGGQPLTQTTTQVPASQVGTQRKPHVEKASTASPGATSDQPLDPWQEAVIAYRKEQDGAKGMW